MALTIQITYNAIEIIASSNDNILLRYYSEHPAPNVGDMINIKHEHHWKLVKVERRTFDIDCENETESIKLYVS